LEFIKINDAVAEVLALHEGELSLGLKELSAPIADALSKHKGGLSLSGLTEISDAAAESISRLQGDLSLGGLTEISDAVADSLSKHEGSLNLDGLSKLSTNIARSLSIRKGSLSLCELELLSAEEVEYLSNIEELHIEDGFRDEDGNLKAAERTEMVITKICYGKWWETRTVKAFSQEDEDISDAWEDSEQEGEIEFDSDHVEYEHH
jgi:hypothetical protein